MGEIDLRPWERFGVHNERPVYIVSQPEIRRWIEEQSPSMWEPYVYCSRDYVFTKEFESWFLLKWS